MLSDLIFLAFGISSIAGYFRKNAGYTGIIISSAAFMILQDRSGTYLSYFSLIASSVWIVVGIYSIWYGKKYGKWLSSLLALMIMGMSLILVSTNYLEIISGWEIMSVPAYLMVGLNRKTDGPAFTFMVFSEFSTILLISGAAYAYFLTGSIAISPVDSYIPLLLISLGSMIKMGMTPFMISEWLPIAHGNAPANASAVLSATMTLMGVYFIMRMILITPIYIGMGILFLAIGAVSILFSSLYAYVSENMKMLAGFSTIENNAAILSAMGLYIIAASPTLREFLSVTIIIFALAHALSKTGIFMSIGNTSAEYFGQINEPTSNSQRIGTFISAMSLSGLFPTIGGLATWMLLESFFMQAYFGGALGIIAIVAGSVVALSEGMATGGMMKVLAFGTLFRRGLKRKSTPGELTLSSLGVLLILLFAFAVLLVPGTLLSGMPQILIFKGLMIESKFGAADFGLVSPDYLIIIIAAFSLLIYGIFGRPKAREVPVWHGGSGEHMQPFTSYAYSNNIRMLVRRVLRTDPGKAGLATTLVDTFTILMVDTGKGYRKFAKFFIMRLMNSSISWYMAYMIAGFLVVILVSVLVY